MIISKPKLIIDPYEWLPGYGESDVTCRTNGVDMILEIKYEKDICNESVIEVRRDILFSSVKTFIKQPFPAVGLFEFNGDPSEFHLGHLTEFTESELALKIMASSGFYSGRKNQNLRHFSIQFLSENICFDVICENVSLSEEISAY